MNPLLILSKTIFSPTIQLIKERIQKSVCKVDRAHQVKEVQMIQMVWTNLSSSRDHRVEMCLYASLESRSMITSILFWEMWKILSQKPLATSWLESLKILSSSSYTIKSIQTSHCHQLSVNQQISPREERPSHKYWPHWKTHWRFYKEIQSKFLHTFYKFIIFLWFSISANTVGDSELEAMLGAERR